MVDEGRALARTQHEVAPTSRRLRTKLRVPSAGEPVLVRGRLHLALDRAVASPLVTVTAPAGSGKSALLAAWTATTRLRVAWLTLDELDQAPSQFWQSLIAAVQLLEPGCGAEAVDLAIAGAGSAEIVAELAVALRDRDGAEPAVIVVDDLHAIDEPTLEHDLGELAPQLPAWLHLVLSSRREPHLPVDRLRARGHLAELRFAELRFTDAEAHELLERLVPDASTTWIEHTTGRVGGWAAGLRLAALAARSAQVAAVPDETADLGELLEHYVVHEVLAREPRAVVDALRALAIVDHFDLDLAQELTGRTDAEALVRDAVARGLFVFRRGSGEHQIHPLVRDVLVRTLHADAPALEADLHARAASWFEHHDAVEAALDHWLAAGRHREALHLLATHHVDLYDSGELDVIERTIGAIPPRAVSMDFGASLELAWCHLLVSQERFVDQVDRLAWWAERTPPVAPLAARTVLLRSVAAGVSGDWTAAGALARRAMAELGDDWPFDPIGRFGFNMVAREVAITEAWDDADESVRDIDLTLAWDPARRLAFEGVRAVGLALAGRPVHALRVAAGVRHAADVTNMVILRCELQLAEALADRELGDHDRAMAELESLAASPTAPMAYVAALALAELTCGHVGSGDLDAARATLRRLEELAGRCYGGHEGRTLVARTAATVALASGDTAAAREHGAIVGDPFWRHVTMARIALAEGDRGAALDALELALPRCPRHELVLHLLRARAVLDTDLADKHALAAVEVATANDLLQTVAAEGVEAAELVERCAWRAPDGWIDRLRRGAVTGGGTVRASAGVGVETLTERERDVLRFLPSRLTLREIAQELYISTNTLKFHLKVIYRKLGVNSRHEAAAVARGLTSVRTR